MVLVNTARAIYGMGSKLDRTGYACENCMLESQYRRVSSWSIVDYMVEWLFLRYSMVCLIHVFDVVHFN